MTKHRKVTGIIDRVKEHNFTKELKDYEYEAKFDIENDNASLLDCLKSVRKSFSSNLDYVVCSFRNGDKIKMNVDFFIDGDREYSYFKYKGANMLKVKNHNLIKNNSFTIFKNKESLLIEKEDFENKLTGFRVRFKKHNFKIKPKKYILDIINSDKILRAGSMMKERVKDFVVDLRYGRIYSISVSFCVCQNRIQKQLEIEYSGFLRNLDESRVSIKKREGQSETEIIECISRISKIIVSNCNLKLKPSCERKLDFVKLTNKPSDVVGRKVIFISGPHGSGKSTLLKNIIEKYPELIIENDIDINFAEQIPSINNLSNFQRSLIRLVYRKFRELYAFKMSGLYGGKIILTDRSIYDSLAYINTYRKLKWISEREYSKLISMFKDLDNLPKTIILNPSVEVIKKRLNKRRNIGNRRTRDVLFKKEDSDLFIELLHNEFEKLKGKLGILYIEDNSDLEIEKILNWIER